MVGMGEKNLYFPLLKSVKHQKAPLRRFASTNFVAELALRTFVIIFQKEKDRHYIYT